MKIGKKTTVLLAALLLAVCISLSSCSGVFSDPKSLMAPPKSSGTLSGIEDALSHAIGNQFTFVYPLSGDFRSSCTMQDITGDGDNEAVVFYELNDNNEIHMNYLTLKNDEWTSTFDMKLSCINIDRIAFADLCGDSTLEVMIGCSLYNENEKIIYIYSVKNGVFSQLSQESYTDFSVCNILNDDKPQIILFSFGANTVLSNAESDSTAVQKYASAKLLSLNSSADGVTTVVGNVLIDRSITSISLVSEGKTDDGHEALYVDAYKGASVMITELIYFDKNQKQLVNAYCDATTGENTLTKRQVLLNSRDIDSDKKYEIPFGSEVPGYTDKDLDSKLYYSSWRRSNGNSFVDVATGYFNATDRYFLEVPNEWLMSVTLTIDRKQSTATFYEYDKTGNVGVQLLSIKVFDASKFNEAESTYTIITTSEERIIAAKADDSSSKYAVSIDYIKDNLTVY